MEPGIRFKGEIIIVPEEKALKEGGLVMWADGAKIQGWQQFSQLSVDYRFRLIVRSRSRLIIGSVYIGLTSK